MLKVALTGNIGSGKSTVAKIFRSIGIPVFNADTEAKKLYYLPDIHKKITTLFGNDLYNDEGKLNKEKLAGIIFRDQNALQKVNDIIHPGTLKKYESWLQENKDYKYTIHESAILFENQLQGKFDKIIHVSAPEELRIMRVIERDSTTYETVYERVKNQLPDERKNKMADFVIYNDGEQLIIPQIMKINSILSQQ